MREIRVTATATPTAANQDPVRVWTPPFRSDSGSKSGPGTSESRKTGYLAAVRLNSGLELEGETGREGVARRSGARVVARPAVRSCEQPCGSGVRGVNSQQSPASTTIATNHTAPLTRSSATSQNRSSSIRGCAAPLTGSNYRFCRP